MVGLQYRTLPACPLERIVTIAGHGQQLYRLYYHLMQHAVNAFVESWELWELASEYFDADLQLWVSYNFFKI